jgi:hypothetical protein
LKAEDFETENTEDIIEKGFEGYLNTDEACSIDNLTIATSNIKAVDMGVDDGYALDF